MEQIVLSVKMSLLVQAAKLFTGSKDRNAKAGQQSIMLFSGFVFAASVVALLYFAFVDVVCINGLVEIKLPIPR